MQRLVSLGHLWLIVATSALMACSTVESRREVELFSRLIDIAKQDQLLDKAALSKNLGIAIVEDTTSAEVMFLKNHGLREREDLYQPLLELISNTLKFLSQIGPPDTPAFVFFFSIAVLPCLC